MPVSPPLIYIINSSLFLLYLYILREFHQSWAIAVVGTRMSVLQFVSAL